MVTPTRDDSGVVTLSLAHAREMVLSTKRGTRLSTGQQLALARRPEAEVRALLAASEGLAREVQEVLVEDVSVAVVNELLANKHRVLPEHLQLQLAQRCVESVGITEWSRRFNLLGLGEAAQLHLAERCSGLSTDMVLSKSSHLSVLRALLHNSKTLSVLTCMLDNPVMLDADLWVEVLKRMKGAHVTLHEIAARKTHFASLPDFVREAFLEFDASVHPELLKNPEFALDTSLPVALLQSGPRGREFLQGQAPQARGVWDALSAEWAGDVTSLLAACQSFAPENARA